MVVGLRSCFQSMISTSRMVELSKQQTGSRIDRIPFKQFQRVYALEKLRAGKRVLLGAD
jgi:hypothetical protein